MREPQTAYHLGYEANVAHQAELRALAQQERCARQARAGQRPRRVHPAAFIQRLHLTWIGVRIRATSAALSHG